MNSLYSRLLFPKLTPESLYVYLMEMTSKSHSTRLLSTETVTYNQQIHYEGNKKGSICNRRK